MEAMHRLRGQRTDALCCGYVVHGLHPDALRRGESTMTARTKDAIAYATIGALIGYIVLMMGVG
jgi:hypothetical protein